MTNTIYAEELHLDLPLAAEPQLPAVLDSVKPNKAPIKVELTESQREKAQQLAEQIDASDPQFVINFGSSAQTKIAEMVGESSTNTLAESGAAGKLLLIVKQHTQEITKDDVESINPSGFPKSFSQLTSRVVNALPFIGKNLEQRIEEFALKKETVANTLSSIAQDLQVESNVSMALVEQLGELTARNREYYDDLKIIKGALAIALEREKKTLESLRNDMTSSNDQYELTRLTEKNDEIERLERRMDAIEKSLALAVLHRAEIAKVKEILIYNAEALQEAHSVMIPMWNMNIELILTLLKTNDQQRIIQELRTTSDQLGLQAAELIKKLDDAQWSMKERTFVAAEVVALGYDRMREGIEAHISRIENVRQKRDEGQKLMYDAQVSFANSIKDLANNLLEGPKALDTQLIENKGSKADVAAKFLDKK